MEQQQYNTNWQRESDVEQLIARWSGLTFSNDFIFGAVLKSNLDICRRLLQCVLEVPIRRVELVAPQREISPALGAKSVRLDAYVNDDSGRVFDVEMQQSAALQLPKRARYYQAAMDTEQLDKGADYEQLPETFVIFFCTFDPFGRGLKRYTYRQACVEDCSFVPWDGTERVYLNAVGTNGTVNEELQGVLDYLSGHNEVGNDLVRDIKGAVTQVLSSEEKRRDFVNMELKLMDARRHAMAEGRREGLEAGRAEGRAEGRNSTLDLLAKVSAELERRGRGSELSRAVAEPEYLDALCKEFDIK